MATREIEVSTVHRGPGAEGTAQAVPIRKLSVIAPTYNEAENVTPLIAALEAALDGIEYEILISDDDSPDRTWAKVEEIGKRNPRVRALRRTQNRGLGPAVVDGFSEAQGDAVACIDADLQHDPSILPRMLDQLCQGADLVVGSRYMPGGGTSGWHPLRRLGSWCATKFTQRLLGLRLRDPMSGYFMMRRDDFLRVRNSLNSEGFKILLEIAAKLKPRAVREVPYTFRARAAGKSKLRGKVVAAYLRQLWRLSLLGRIVPAEFVRFGTVGATGIVVNLVVMAVLLHATSYRDWRASALASLAATVNNYILNNFWTFRDRAHSGMTLVSRYVSYLLVSLVGLGVTTATYVGITRVLGHIQGLTSATASLHSAVLLFCQFIAVLVGTFFNYSLNRNITWPHSEPPQV